MATLFYFIGLTATAMLIPASVIFYLTVCKYVKDYGSLDEDKPPEPCDFSKLGLSRRELERQTAYIMKLEKRRRKSRRQYRRLG